MSRRLKLGAIAFGSLFVIWNLLGLCGAYLSTQARLVDIPQPESFFPAQVVEDLPLEASDGQILKAWYLPQPNASKAVILLSGIGGNRLGMVERAKIYLELGFAVLMPDLRGTGESKGGRITFGWQERLDLLAAFAFLEQKGIPQIGVHGCSLGAATITYTFGEQKKYQFVVLESPYDNIEQALANRLSKWHLPLFLFRPLIWWTEWLIGTSAKTLSPEEYIRYNHAPTLLLAGDAELKVKKAETEKIFQNCAAKEKRLHFFAGAKHVDFLTYDPTEYPMVLNKWLQGVVNFK